MYEKFIDKSIISKDTLVPIGFVILLLTLVVTFNSRLTTAELNGQENKRDVEQIEKRIENLESKYFDSLLEISIRLENIETTLNINQ